MNQQFSKFVTPSETLMHIVSYQFDCPFRILGIELKFGQLLVQLMRNISNLFLAVFVN